MKSVNYKRIICAGVIMLGLLLARFEIRSRLPNTTLLAPLPVFLLSTGSIIDPDHEYFYQPDELNGIILFGTADYLRGENEPEWSYVSTGGFFKTVEDATPSGLRKLGWNRGDDKFEAARLWTSEVILPPVLMMNDPDNYFVENIEEDFYTPKFLETEVGGVQINAWLKYEGSPTTQFQYKQEQFVYDEHGNLIERKIIAQN